MTQLFGCLFHYDCDGNHVLCDWFRHLRFRMSTSIKDYSPRTNPDHSWYNLAVCEAVKILVHEPDVHSRWLDKTPTSRIITRCTQDIQARKVAFFNTRAWLLTLLSSVDGPISEYLGWLFDMTISMIIKFITIVYIAPFFSIPGVLISLLGAWCGQVYIKAQLSVKREMSNARAPVLGHFGAAVAGLTSIRAYGAEEAFKVESYKRIDRYTRASRSFYNLNRYEFFFL
jgi:ABC-type multidrug transport system fused ATPase/permease subunit